MPDWVAAKKGPLFSIAGLLASFELPSINHALENPEVNCKVASAAPSPLRRPSDYQTPTGYNSLRSNSSSISTTPSLPSQLGTFWMEAGGPCVQVMVNE